MLSTKLKLLCTMSCKTHITFLCSTFKEAMLSSCSRCDITLYNINKSCKNARDVVTRKSWGLFFLNNIVEQTCKFQLEDTLWYIFVYCSLLMTWSCTQRRCRITGIWFPLIFCLGYWNFNEHFCLTLLNSEGIETGFTYIYRFHSAFKNIFTCNMVISTYAKYTKKCSEIWLLKVVSYEQLYLLK